MEISFASGTNFYKLFWVFFIGCFMGVVTETIWCVIKLHRFESRKGLIYGPFNLVYGLGALMMTLVLRVISDKRDLVIFLSGALLGGIYEYICSLFQEKFFGSISWDYKKFPFNLNGRINLLYCFFWGLLTLLWIKDIYPKISYLVEKIPNAYGKPITWLLLLFMILNTVISALAVYRKGDRLKGIPPKNSFWVFIDRKYPDEKITKIYPNMTFFTEK